ncbi:hypothetical protein V9T40_012214 [Parthenolecanium corni]|uniref:Uncharacterized protein n=1 Tax=Parthenolecanium corni TaxID=536013 RepID=A0AAN9Y0A7_9HEMI
MFFNIFGGKGRSKFSSDGAHKLCLNFRLYVKFFLQLSHFASQLSHFSSSCLNFRLVVSIFGWMSLFSSGYLNFRLFRWLDC